MVFGSIMSGEKSEKHIKMLVVIIFRQWNNMRDFLVLLTISDF